MSGLRDVLDLALDVGGILLLVFYGSLVLWTYKDARRRIDDPILVATAVATSMLPIVGVLVYMLLRPPEYLADVRERELEIRAMERQLGRQERCPYCRSHIEGDFLSCPVCKTKLRSGCVGCERPLDPRWAMCPYCETEVPASQRREAVPGRPPRGPEPPRGGQQPGRAPSSSSRPAAPRERERSGAGRGGERTSSGTPRRDDSSSSSRGGSASKPPGRGKEGSSQGDARSAGMTSRSTVDQPTMAFSGPTSERS